MSRPRVLPQRNKLLVGRFQEGRKPSFWSQSQLSESILTPLSPDPERTTTAIVSVAVLLRKKLTEQVRAHSLMTAC